MKNTLLTLAGAAAVFVAVAQTSSAVPIVGSIGFAGSLQLNSGNLATATTVVNWFGETVQAGSTAGTFSTALGSLGGQAVNLAAPWQFSLGGPVSPFWSVTGTQGGAGYNGTIFTFNLASSSSILSVIGGFNTLTIFMAGTVSAIGFDTTAFTGSFSIQEPPANGIANFTESLSFHSVPDGGTTVMLLGAALSGMALIKRKFMA